MSIEFDFSSRGVLITGAAQGIGFEMADFFRRAGAAVWALDANEDLLREAWSGSEVSPVVCDVADARAVDAAVEEMGWHGQAIDVLVNNAGIARDAVVWKLTDDAWRSVLDVHLTGTFNCTRAVVPAMRQAGRGRIINVTSYTGIRGNIGQANYAAAKAGIIGFTKTVAKEVARFGITVNAISPNAESPMVATIPREKKAALTAQIPMGRFGSATEMAPAVGFLASDEAGYITGAVLPVDGGLSM